MLIALYEQIAAIMQQTHNFHHAFAEKGAILRSFHIFPR